MGKARRVATAITLCGMAILAGRSGAEYEIPWYVFASGGGKSGDVNYELTGTLGHANGTESAGGGYTHGEGFWRNGELCFAPAGAPALTVSRPGPDLELSWSSIAGAAVYDVIRGDLATLRSTAGDFAGATDGCVIDGTTSTTIVEPTGTGELYFLVRPLACSPGSYDSSSSSQSGARDPEIGVAAAACP